MFMPISDRRFFVASVMAAALAACTGESAETTASVPEAGIDDGRLDCALAGSDLFKRNCALERIESDGRQELVIRHPDGGFRRFALVSDGRGLVTADGAETAQIALADNGRIIVSVGDDRYRLPAKLKSTGDTGEAESAEQN